MEHAASMLMPRVEQTLAANKGGNTCCIAPTPTSRSVRASGLWNLRSVHKRHTNPKANFGSFNSHHSHFIALYSYLHTSSAHHPKGTQPHRRPDFQRSNPSARHPAAKCNADTPHVFTPRDHQPPRQARATPYSFPHQYSAGAIALPWRR